MKLRLKLFLIVVLAAIVSLMLTSCAPSSVSVGVGVGVAGPYGGRYPGGSGVWVARPMYPPAYYPSLPTDDGREFVKNLDVKPSEAIVSATEKETPEFYGPFPVAATPDQ